MHLTNFALNKNSKDFQSNEGLAHHDEGSKRSVTATLWQLEESFGASAEDMWQKVARLACNTLMALRPGLVEHYVHERPKPLHPLGPKSFQIIGMDILIDSKLEPRLIELNANPSLSALAPSGTTGSPPQELELPEIAHVNSSPLPMTDPFPNFGGTPTGILAS